MRCLLRQISRREGGAAEYRDAELEVDEIRIGHAGDQDIVLAGGGVALRHARLKRRRDGSCEIINVGTGEVLLNDKPVAAGRFEVGDRLAIAGHQLKRIAAPPGFDLALELEMHEGADAGEVPAAVAAGDLVPIGWSKRRWSWILGIGFLAAGLVVPLVAAYIPPLQQVLRAARIAPSDHWWDSGPLIAAHGTPPAGANCTACHQMPFRMVRDDACGECHQDITHHTATTDLPMASDLAQQRCASCHKEHSGAAGIVRKDSDFCVQCHGALKAALGDKTELADVHDFAKRHPDFRLTFLRPTEDPSGIKWEKVRLALDPQTREQSNLEFNHKVHIDPAGVDSPDGKKYLNCGSCHQPDASGVAMRPIDMKSHCSDCHTLQYEGVSLPHASVEQVMNVLRGSQGRRVAAAAPLREDVMVAPRRRAKRPGESAQEISRAPTGGGIEHAARELFDRTLCVVCHKEIDRSGPEPTWKVRPVRLNQSWMPSAHFSHKSHAQQKCVACHEADKSERSQEVLMPAIGQCRECHAGGPVTAGLDSSCVSCHRFHIPGKPKLLPERVTGVVHGKS